MRKSTLLVLLAAFVVAAAPAGATCPVGKTMGTYGSVGPDGYYSVVIDPGVGLGSIQADWWKIGSGALVNNGTYQPDGTNGTQPWFFPSQTPNGLSGGWTTNTGATVGCPFPGDHMALALYDRSGDNSTAFFGVAVTDVIDSRTIAVDFALGGNPVMHPVPKPNITFANKTPTTLTMNLQWDLPPGGFCRDGTGAGHCPGGAGTQVIQGWDIYKRERAKADPTSDNVRPITPGCSASDTNCWTLVSSAPGGGNATTASVTFSCSTTTARDAQLALVPRLDGGFVPNFAGAGSSRIECNPTLADPGTKYKIIDKKPTTKGPAKQ